MPYRDDYQTLRLLLFLPVFNAVLVAPHNTSVVKVLCIGDFFHSYASMKRMFTCRSMKRNSRCG